ncbi:MAG: type II toxin-antitoxin system VapC family toxin [Chloroflexota bacterium]
MIAFDTDVLTGILLGRPNYVAQLNTIPVEEQSVPIIVVEEIMRGRLNTIRRAESGKARISLSRAYELFTTTFQDFQTLQPLPYTAEAERQFQAWRKQKIRVGTHDLRIAAICVAHHATLISRNRRDFERIPNLSVEFWN